MVEVTELSSNYLGTNARLDLMLTRLEMNI